MASCWRALNGVDRALIEVRLQDGWCLRAIARALGRSPGTVSDEVGQNQRIDLLVRISGQSKNVRRL